MYHPLRVRAPKRKGDVPPEDRDAQSAVDLQLAGMRLRLYGATIAPALDASVTHVLTVPQLPCEGDTAHRPPVRAEAIIAQYSALRRAHAGEAYLEKHTVTLEWVRHCVERGQYVSPEKKLGFRVGLLSRSGRG